MIGRIQYIREKGRGEISLAYVGPLTVMTAELRHPERMSAKGLARRLKRLERTLCRRGIGRVILPRGFPYTDQLERLRPVETLPFYRAVADVLALGLLDSRGIAPERGRVALAAPWLCPELRNAAERLCPQVRELVIHVPEEGEDYARQLHARYGLPVTPRSAQADVTVAFGPVEGMEGRALALYGKTPDLGGLELTAQGLELPTDCTQPFLALLWEAGALERGALRATISLQTLANG